MSDEHPRCPLCNRFMKRGGYYTNDSYDSWEDTWRCTTKHDTTEGADHDD